MKLSREQVFTFTDGNPYLMDYWDNVYSNGRFFTWNWAAAIFQGLWGVYRGAYIFALHPLLFIFLGIPLGGYFFLCNAIFFGVFGTGLYFRWMEWKIRHGVKRCRPKILPALGVLGLCWIIATQNMFL